MDKGEQKKKYEKLLHDIPKLACDIKVFKDHGRDPSNLEHILEEKQEELLQVTKTMHPHGDENGLLLVVSAPSGTGKTTICRRLLKIISTLTFSVSCTTRSPRKGERNGFDYHFISDEEFHREIASGNFIEWAENYGFLYGTSREEVKHALDRNHDFLFDVDPRGARAIKESYPNGVFVFILPPSLDTLKTRLTKRGSEKREMMKIRVDKAVDELKEVLWYDYVIFNDTIEASVDILRSIYIAEKNKVKRSRGKINALTI